ncbi:MAG: glycosyltransferase [Candidatus Hinthialibacter antarcticus]|nr:glycosyltransferase [Candidatus Hinthialibacter antarcticus]
MNNPTWLPLHEFNTALFTANLKFLNAFGSKITTQVQFPTNDEDIQVQSLGTLVAARSLKNPDQWIFGQSPAQEIAAIRNAMQSIPPDSELAVLIGSKAGYAAGPMASLLQQRPRLRVVVLEPSTERMRLCLSTNDLRDAIRTGRFIVAITPDREAGLWRTIDDNSLWNAQSPCCIVFDDAVDESIVERFQADYPHRSQAAQSKRSEILSSLKQTAENSKQPIERVLLFDCWPGAPQQAHIEAMQKALNARNIQNRVIQLKGFRFDQRLGEYRRELEHTLLNTLDEFRPELIASYAYHAPQIMAPDLFDAVGAPWVQVVSNIAYYDREYYDNEICAVIDRRLISIYEQRGAPQAAFVPIMADYVADAPTPTCGELPIVFVGNSLGLQSAERDHWLQVWKPRERAFNAINEAERALSEFDLQLNLYDYLEQNPIPDLGEDESYQAFRYLLCQSTAARRMQILERLADKGLHVYGNWRRPPNSPLTSCLHGPLPMEQEQTLFKRGAIFINIHSTGHLTGPNMRFFNIAGMGGFQLSDGAFDEFLEPGKEYASYQSLDEAVQKVEFYLQHPEQMNDIRQQAWQRVQRDWTYNNWLDWVEPIMQRSFINQ